MGGDITNVKNSNLKVPPLKIVLSSATSGGSDRSSSTSPSSESESLDSNLTIISENNQQPHEHISKQTDLSNNGSGSSNINKDDANQGNKLDRASRHASKGTSGNGGDQKGANAADQKTTSTTTLTGTTNSGLVNQNNNNNSNKRLQDNTINCDQTATKDPSNSSSSSSNQRITRSSQRAAQQNKSDNSNETTGDDTNLAENQERSTSESGQRKVKRRKNLLIELTEETHNQQVTQPEPDLLPSICPADYQLPSQNAFELYRDIRNRPYTKMNQLNCIQPKVPHGFKDYFICSGPYLLEGNKVGVGINGSKILDPRESSRSQLLPQARCSSGLALKKPYLAPSSQRKSSPSNCSPSFHQRHSSYNIPKLLQAPKHLKSGSPLFELFQDQERARQKMRMQHLKERERSVLSSEQEILRAYNRVAIADNRQTLHFSACTYFYYQERYHYIDEKSNYLDSINQKDSSQSRENSDSCNAENVTASVAAERLQVTQGRSNGIAPRNSTIDDVDKSKLIDEIKQEKGSPNLNRDLTTEQQSASNGTSNDARPPNKRRKGEPENDASSELAAANTCDTNSDKATKPNDNESSSGGQNTGGEVAMATNKDTASDTKPKAEENDSINEKKVEPGSVDISDADLKQLNKTMFINNLQEIDDKWAKIKDEMFVRHKNESDSLCAVQCLEWEWKAKEIGVCDVRLSLRIDPEFVPRVEVSSLDY